MELDQVSLIVNGSLLAVTIVMGFIILHAGAAYNFHTGNNPEQERYRYRIFRLLLLLIAISLSAAIFNILYPVFIG